MSKRGPKPTHLALVDATTKVEEAAETCGGRTRAGHACKKPLGQGTNHAGVGRCRLHDGQVEEGSPCPLPLDDLERRLWDMVVGQLIELRIYKPAFWPHIFGLVVALAGLHSARQYGRVGSTVRGENGADKKHPSSTVVNQMLAQIRQYSNDLGLNPSALASMDVGGDSSKPRDKMEQLIRGRPR